MRQARGQCIRHPEQRVCFGAAHPIYNVLQLHKPVTTGQAEKIPWMNSVFGIVDISVEDYIRRGFESLSVNFGCTGGQHRSVYAADALARHLRNKFKVKIELSHTVQDARNWQNPLPDTRQ